MTGDWDREAFLDNDLPPREERTYRTGREIIVEVVDEHGEEWVLEHYYRKIYPVGIIKDVPRKEELPFFDEERHDAMSKEEVAEMYRKWSQYRENLRTMGTSTGDDEE